MRFMMKYTLAYSKTEFRFNSEDVSIKLISINSDFIQQFIIIILYYTNLKLP